VSRPLAVVPDPTPLPASFGAYAVEGLLGEGTMGSVYRARHQTLGRKVAIKRLHPKLLSDQALVKRFLQEARLVNTINHPHIIEVQDFVEAPGEVYAVMELLEGETLNRRLSKRALSLAEIVDLATQIAEALEAAHALAVVHRDLKPDNVFLTTRDGKDWVKVLDFGVAKLLSTEGPRVVETQNGDVLGTPRYMAPEQAAGLDVDARTDVYAFGTLLFELLAGQPPFDATVFGQLAADIITRPPPPVPELTRTGEAVPQPLRALVAACLAKNADHRPASMSEVKRRLLHFDEDLGDFPTSIRPSRWPLVAGAAVGVVFLVVAIAAVFAPTKTGPAVEPTREPTVERPAVPPTRAEVTLFLETAPTGAWVYDEAGTQLGQTPFTLKHPPVDTPLTLHLELKGYEPVTRQFPASENLRVELPLKRVVQAAPKKQNKPVTDGVLDPF